MIRILILFNLLPCLLFAQSKYAAMDSAILSGKFGDVHSVLVYQDGNITFEKYYNGWKPDSIHQLQSATKSVIATLLGIALQRGYIKSEDEPIYKYLPNVPEDKKSIRIEDLLTQRHGIKWTEGAWEDENNSWRAVMETQGSWYDKILSMPMDTLPGTKFNYSNAAPALISYIIQTASKMTIDSFTKEYLFKPLGIHQYWFLQRNGGPQYNGMALISLTSQDMLKLGQLYLQNGKWNGNQILSKQYVKKAISPIVRKVGANGVFYHYDYGYFWWSNPAYRLAKVNKSTSPVVMARGAGGQNIIIDFARRQVTVITAWNMARSNWPQAIYHDFIE